MNIKDIFSEKRQIVIIGLAVALLAAFIVYWQFFFSPLQSEVRQIRSQVQDIDVTIKAEEARIQAEGYQEEIAKIQQKLNVLEKKFSSKTLPATIDELFGQAEKLGIRIGSFTPQAPVEIKSSVEPGSRLVFTRVPILMNLEVSGLEELGEFLKSVFETPDFAFGFDNLIVQQEQEGGQLKVELLLSAYLLTSPESIKIPDSLEQKLKR